LSSTFYLKIVFYRKFLNHPDKMEMTLRFAIPLLPLLQESDIKKINYDKEGLNG